MLLSGMECLKVIGKQVEERPVWGIDAYTRKMIELALDLSPLTQPAKKAQFIEKVGLRATGHHKLC